MIVVSDTSPILHLSRAGHLDLLRSLFGRVLIPPAVARELVELASRYEDFEFSPNWDWGLVHGVGEQQIDARVADANLDEGETEAISLALVTK